MPVIDAYRDVVGRTREFAHNMNGTRDGDPRKAAAAIEAALDAPITPLRLQLSADAVEAIRSHSSCCSTTLRAGKHSPAAQASARAWPEGIRSSSRRSEMQSGKLRGKVALVTGASSGIGEATALALSAEGARVAIAARRVQRLNDLADRIRQAGGDALPIEADVTHEAQASAMVERVLRENGRLDLLLNIAGMGVAARSRTRPPRNIARWSTSTFLGSSIRSTPRCRR
jgi:hypothetical protein